MADNDDPPGHDASQPDVSPRSLHEPVPPGQAPPHPGGVEVGQSAQDGAADARVPTTHPASSPGDAPVPAPVTTSTPSPRPASPSSANANPLAEMSPRPRPDPVDVGATVGASEHGAPANARSPLSVRIPATPGSTRSARSFRSTASGHLRRAASKVSEVAAGVRDKAMRLRRPPIGSLRGRLTRDGTVDGARPDDDAPGNGCDAAGGFGRVHILTHVEDARIFAVKVLQCDAERMDDVIGEVQAMARAQSAATPPNDNVVEMYDSWAQEQKPVIFIDNNNRVHKIFTRDPLSQTAEVYIVMEYMPYSLDSAVLGPVPERLQLMHRSDEPLVPPLAGAASGRDPSALHRIAVHMLRGIAGMHRQGTTHCDIKGANVLVTARGDVKVADFGATLQAASPSTDGLTVKVESEDTSTPGNFADQALPLRAITAPFVPPEAWVSRRATQAFDVFSTGVTLLGVMLASPDDTSLPSFLPTVPAALQHLFDQAQAINGAAPDLVTLADIVSAPYKWLLACTRAGRTRDFDAVNTALMQFGLAYQQRSTGGDASDEFDAAMSWTQALELAFPTVFLPRTLFSQLLKAMLHPNPSSRWTSSRLLAAMEWRTPETLFAPLPDQDAPDVFRVTPEEDDVATPACRGVGSATDLLSPASSAISPAAMSPAPMSPPGRVTPGAGFDGLTDIDAAQQAAHEEMVRTGSPKKKLVVDGKVAGAGKPGADATEQWAESQTIAMPTSQAGTGAGAGAGAGAATGGDQPLALPAIMSGPADEGDSKAEGPATHGASTSGPAYLWNSPWLPAHLRLPLVVPLPPRDWPPPDAAGDKEEAGADIPTLGSPTSVRKLRQMQQYPVDLSVAVMTKRQVMTRVWDRLKLLAFLAVCTAFVVEGLRRGRQGTNENVPGDFDYGSVASAVAVTAVVCAGAVAVVGYPLVIKCRWSTWPTVLFTVLYIVITYLGLQAALYFGDQGATAIAGCLWVYFVSKVMLAYLMIGDVWRQHEDFAQAMGGLLRTFRKDIGWMALATVLVLMIQLGWCMFGVQVFAEPTTIVQLTEMYLFIWFANVVRHVLHFAIATKVAHFLRHGRYDSVFGNIKMALCRHLGRVISVSFLATLDPFLMFNRDWSLVLMGVCEPDNTRRGGLVEGVFACIYAVSAVVFRVTHFLLRFANKYVLTVSAVHEVGFCKAQLEVQREATMYANNGANSLSAAFHTMELTLTFMCTLAAFTGMALTRSVYENASFYGLVVGFMAARTAFEPLSAMATSARICVQRWEDQALRHDREFFAAFVSSLNAKLRAATIAGLRAHDLVTVRSLSDGTPPPTPMNSSPSKPGSGGAGLTHQAAQSTALAQAAGGDIESGTGDGAPASAMAPAKETSVPANSPLVVDGATPVTVAAGIV